ncbi:hypothetical protein [Kibdelosporangium aridum]|nr:hypothetical protein [Kibdelosporangium aridum]
MLVKAAVASVNGIDGMVVGGNLEEMLPLHLAFRAGQRLRRDEPWTAGVW